MDKEFIEILSKLDSTTLEIARAYIVYLYVEMFLGFTLVAALLVGMYKSIKFMVNDIHG